MLNWLIGSQPFQKHLYLDKIDIQRIVKIFDEVGSLIFLSMTFMNYIILLSILNSHGINVTSDIYFTYSHLNYF
jgi:hypothetical protein